MCGFLSVLSNGIIKDIDKKKFKKASDLLVHRGPDDTHYTEYNSYFSVFHRLSIRDLSSHSRQPLLTNCGRYDFCFNGEIYNIEELNDLFPETKNLNSDTLLISLLISSLGIDAINHLRGMFAISIYDKLNKKLYLARDSFGIKPLFYLRILNDRFFVAASEIKALLNLIDSKKPDLNQCRRFLMMGVSNDNDDTFFQNIKSVPKGYILEINNKLEIKYIKTKNHLDNINLIPTKKFDFNKHNLFLTNIIKEHLVSDVPIATTISGGIDSSMVSLTVDKYSKGNTMFSAVSEIFQSEISSKRVTEYKEKLVEINCDLLEPVKHIDSIIERLSSPFESSSWIYQDILMKKIASNFKYKVLLVGEGADEIYSGYKRLFYPYLYALEIGNHLELFNNSISSFSDFLGINTNGIKENYQKYLIQLNSITDYEDAIFSKYLLLDQNLNYERYFPSKKELGSDPNIIYKKHLLSYINRADIPSTLYILDNLSMSHGIELRVPFIDIKLLNEVMSYGFESHFNSGFNKYLLRKSSFLVSEEVRWNKVKKQRPSAVSFLVYESLKEELKILLSKDNLLLNTSLIKKDFELSLENKDPRFARFMFRIYTFLKFWDKNF